MDEGQGNPWDAPEGGSTPSTAPAVEPSPAPPAGDPNRNKVIFIALGAFVVILVAGVLLSQGGGSDDGKVKTNGTTTVSTPGVTPAQSLAITGTIDNFDRADNKDQLGELPNGSPWTVQQGSWGIVDKSAYVSNPDLKHRNIAFVGTGYAEGQAQVKITKMAPQAGIVFRYTGACSYWAIESAPAAVTWNIIKVEKCKATTKNTGYTPIGDGTTVGVRFDKTSVTVVINGKVVKTLQDDSLAGSGKVGLVVSGKNAGKARFDDFVAGGLKGQGIVKPGAKGGKGPTTTAPAGGATTTTIK